MSSCRPLTNKLLSQTLNQIGIYKRSFNLRAMSAFLLDLLAYLKRRSYRFPRAATALSLEFSSSVLSPITRRLASLTQQQSWKTKQGSARQNNVACTVRLKTSHTVAYPEGLKPNQEGFTEFGAEASKMPISLDRQQVLQPHYIETS